MEECPETSDAEGTRLLLVLNGESLEEILRLLSVNGGLRYVRRSETIYIYKK